MENSAVVKSYYPKAKLYTWNMDFRGVFYDVIEPSGQGGIFLGRGSTPNEAWDKAAIMTNKIKKLNILLIQPNA